MAAMNGMWSTSRGAKSAASGGKAKQQRTPSLAERRGAGSKTEAHLVVIRFVRSYGGLPAALSLFAVLWLLFLIQSHETIITKAPGRTTPPLDKTGTSKGSASQVIRRTTTTSSSLPVAFERLLDRARHKEKHCLDLGKGNRSAFTKSFSVAFGNETVASLPSFGIIDALEEWKRQDQSTTTATSRKLEKQHTLNENNKWQCELPPDTECGETQFTVIFMAYNPDRLGMTFRQIRKMLDPNEYGGLVKEIIIVWNGPRDVSESTDGRQVLEYARQNPASLRFAYPLKMGLPNDLMNRYHPDVVNVQTKAIMYYDDDGPFYSYKATEGGFELWKRHASAQIGAMSRQIDYCSRQNKERRGLSPDPSDHFFVSHCTNIGDRVDYNFKYFANYDANMVLPSGSFLHSNYLCFLWHPVLEPIRKFVRAHPVHPDDATVSTIVSQLAGRAPRVYSRRLNPDDNGGRGGKNKRRQRRRRLLEWDFGGNNDDYDDDDDGGERTALAGVVPLSEQNRRSLLFNIDWDAGAGMTDAKHYWAALRTEAVNALVQYCGSINSGSIGWCAGTKYYDAKIGGKCNPVMAKQGWLPWMNPDGSPKDTCP